jgi:hypothetical protein
LHKVKKDIDNNTRLVYNKNSISRRRLNQSAERNKEKITMEKWALITGASSGIGAEFARLYSNRGYSVILVARRTDRLLEIADSLKGKSKVITCNLADRRRCFDLYNKVSHLNIELLINCAGFGAVGKFEDIDLGAQIKMTDLNCATLMILTHLFLNDFKKRGRGTILNVASSAGLLPGGPNMAVYYASKAYVVSLTNAISEELKAGGSKVRIAALCPGPVDTEFNQVAGVKFSLKGITPHISLGIDETSYLVLYYS